MKRPVLSRTTAVVLALVACAGGLATAAYAMMDPPLVNTARQSRLNMCKRVPACYAVLVDRGEEVALQWMRDHPNKWKQ